MDYQGKYMMLIDKSMTKVYISKYVDHTAIISVTISEGELKLEIPHNSYILYRADKNTPYSDDLVYADIMHRDINILACYEPALVGKMISGKALMKI